MEKLFTPILPPGFFANGTELQAEGRWSDGRNVRFRNGKIAPIGGYNNITLSGATILGIATGALTVPAQLSVSGYLVYGTDLGYLYAVNPVTGLVTDITPTVGAPPSGSPAGVQWTFTMFGDQVIACAYVPGYGFGPNYWLWDQNISHVFVWASGNWADTGVFHTATQLETPTFMRAAVTTPEHFLMVLGGTFPTSIYGTTTTQAAELSWRRVYWASQGQSFDFRPADVNSAGDFDVPSKGTLVGAKATRGETLIWTTEDLWAATYVGAPFYYSFEQKGQNCGLISPNAACVVDAGAFWLGPDLRFYRYDQAVRPIPCDVEDIFRNSLNAALSLYIWCLANPKQGEVTWFFPSTFSTSSNPNTRSVTYNYEEDHWTYNNAQHLSVTAGDNYPLSGTTYQYLFNPVSTTSKIIQNEIGTTRTSTTYVRTGPIRLGEGDQVVRLQKLVMDELTPNTLAFGILAQMSMDDPGTFTFPYLVPAGTSFVNVRQTGRFFSIYCLENAPASDWRLGKFQLGFVPQGNR